MCNLKYNTNEQIYGTEIDSNTEEKTCGCRGGVEKGSTGSLELANVN